MYFISFFLHELLLLLFLSIHGRSGLLPSRAERAEIQPQWVRDICEWTRTYRGNLPILRVVHGSILSR
jgi:hypothetical protein